MPGLKEYYGDVFNGDWFGIITGTSTAQSLPSGTARLTRFKAGTGNQGDIFIGNEADVVYPLDAGDDTGWFAPVQGKLQNYWVTAENDEVLYWWVQR
jgi:hypothetical protein